MEENAENGKNAKKWEQWDARRYLEEYFGSPSQDVRATTAFVTDSLKEFEGKELSRVLDFGSGPTIIGVASAPRYAKEIHVADYLEPNLNEIRKWKNGEKDAYDFTGTYELVLETEGQTPSAELIRSRDTQLRQKITKILHCDAGSQTPLGPDAQKYPVIISLYCADSATSSKNEWNKFMTNILSLLEPGGTIIMSALRNSEYYTIGDKRFPSANIDENDIAAMFAANGFAPTDVEVQVEQVASKLEQGFTSLLFAKARKGA